MVFYATVKAEFLFIATELQEKNVSAKTLIFSRSTIAVGHRGIISTSDFLSLELVHESPDSRRWR